MGAFGELLIETMGGDLNKYKNANNNNNTKYNKNDVVTEKEKKETIKNYNLTKARNWLEILTNHIMYNPHIVAEINEDNFIHNCEKRGFNKETQKILWKEYNKFINNYVKMKHPKMKKHLRILMYIQKLKNTKENLTKQEIDLLENIIDYIEKVRDNKK
jgi:hypothetical protein